MKTILLTLTIALSSLLLNAQTETTDAGTTIEVSVPVPSDKGNVVFALYDEASFMKEPLAGLTSDIVDGKATATFENITPGTYAVILFHDKNENKKMDFEPNGMPKEMYGVSNNVMSMGPPQFSDAKFEVADDPITLDIRM